mgnify:CR=1 FL=1
MNYLFILNDSPYGSERTFNAVRLAESLIRQEGNAVRLFLMGDAAVAGHGGQKVPKGYYNLQQMLSIVVRHGGEIGVCGTCMDARGIEAEELFEGAHRSTMDELTQWTTAADKVLVF